MANKIKAIETRYKGYRFRSRLEARWAVFFDTLGVKWEYEPEGYDLGEAGWYLPDFWLPEQEYQCWIEVKGVASREDCIKIDTFCNLIRERVFLVQGQPGSYDEIWRHGDGPLALFSRKIDVKFVSHGIEELFTRYDQSDRQGTRLSCPVCGDNNVHFQDATMLDRNDNYAAGEGRDQELRISMNCECGHSWVLRLGHHKGETFAAIEEPCEYTYDVPFWLAKGNKLKLSKAYQAARSARFEHEGTHDHSSPDDRFS